MSNKLLDFMRECLGAFKRVWHGNYIFVIDQDLEIKSDEKHGLNHKETVSINASF